MTIVILIVVFVALGYLYVVIDKKLEKIKKAEQVDCIVKARLKP